MFSPSCRVCVCGSVVAIALGAAGPAQAHGITERVSVNTGGQQGNKGSFDATISADGRFVAFDALATNLVPGDTNGSLDVLVRDRQTGTTERVSLGPGGVQGNADSFVTSISANGRFVAFESGASNLVPGDTNDTSDVFVRDRKMGTTQRVSVSSSSRQGNGGSGSGSISADGRFVAFASAATNLVPGGTDGVVDVFVRDRLNETTELVSLGPHGVPGELYLSSDPSISADGRFVAFESEVTNPGPGEPPWWDDVFVRDRKMGTTQRVSVGPGGQQSKANSFGASISVDGRFVAFFSYASNLVPGDTNDTSDVFVRDCKTGTTEWVSLGPGGVQGNDSSYFPSISADGRFVAFESAATNLVLADTNGWEDVFIRDRKAGVTRRVSLGPASVQGNSSSGVASISADGRFVAFGSDANNLVAHDINGHHDVFVRTLAP